MMKTALVWDRTVVAQRQARASRFAWAGGRSLVLYSGQHGSSRTPRGSQRHHMPTLRVGWGVMMGSWHSAIGRAAAGR